MLKKVGFSFWQTNQPTNGNENIDFIFDLKEIKHTTWEGEENKNITAQYLRFSLKVAFGMHDDGM